MGNTFYSINGSYILLGVKYLVTPRSDLEDAVLVAYDEDDALFVWELEDKENHETEYAAALP